jgi:spermidine synthase
MHESEAKMNGRNDVRSECARFAAVTRATALGGRGALVLAAGLCMVAQLHARVIFETYSPYHFVQVIDQGGERLLSFNGTRETKMSLANPLQGHFEYIEYFHMPWIWNPNLKRVLMIGLGGGSVQRRYQHYHTNLVVDTVELDPVVIDVAKKYFGVAESPTHKIHRDDGRVFLRRTTERYDAIILDAYTTGRYGSSIPPHMTTKEFFTLAGERLGTNGVLAFNVIGQTRGPGADLVGALHRTLQEVFPQVYMFPANSSQNIVFVATKSSERYDYGRVHRDGAALVRAKVVQVPGFIDRLRSFVNTAPANAATSPVLTDDRAPVEALMGGRNR